MSTWSCGASRRVAAAFALAMFVSGLFFPVFPLGGTAWAADDSLNIEMRAILKADVAMEETDLEAEKAKSNVLFMIDSTIPMSFAPKSVMPTVVLASGWVNTYGESADWNATYNVYRHTISDVIRMMSGSTFGMGALPTAWYKGNVTMERNLYGRDVDPSNRFISTGTVEGDIEANKNNYYFPFTSKYPDQVAALKGAYQSQIDPLLTSYTLYKAATHNSNSAHYNLQTDSSNWNKWAGEENGYPVISYGTGYSAAVSSGNSYPYALVFKNPAWWKTGPPSGATAAQIEAELVPNDSRMYQTKLVLWNLLENESLFKNLRFGLATTFLNPINGSGEVTDYSPRHHAGLNIHNPGHGLYTRYDFHGVFKVFPFGANTYSRSSGRPQFVNGVSIQAVSGHMRGYTALHGTYYPMWALQTVETNYSNLRTSNRSTADRNEAELVYRMEHRGSLWLPIRDYGATWKGSFSGATRPTMKHADRFRQWINGLGDIAWTSTVSRNGQYHFYKDPEIGIAGVGLLPMAIYPDPRPGLYLSREYYKGPYFKFGTKAKDGAIFYSYKDYNRDWTLDYYMGSTELENPELNTRMLTNAGSGEAAGSILDFFTPPAGYTSVAGTALGSYLADVSYAVRDVNEDNWVILITSGQEVKPEGDGYAYTTADAIKNLYDATNAARSKDVRTGYTAVMDHNRIYAPYERVMEMPRNADDTKLCEPRIRDLKNPIKTLVVGIVANPLSFDVGSTERRDATEMRANIAKMAKAGQPDNPSAAPFFADNVESLTIALRDALITIGEEREMQSGKGQMMVSTIDDRMGNRGEEIDFSVYSGTYRIRYNDQWEGELRRYDVSQDVSGNMTLYEKWELGKIISGDTVNNKRGANRQLKYWIGKDGATPGKFTSPDQAHDVWKWIGLAAGDRIQPKAAGKPEYTDSLMEWFRGTDRSYLDGFDYFTRGSMLAELSTHGVVMATRPPTGKSLPGYEAWANSKSTDVTMRSKIYAHTNDGVLHLLDAADGDEEMAILPPPMLLPTRLATLKTNVVSQTKPYLRWISSSMPEGQSGALRSNPVYLLDGALQVRRFDMGSGGVYSEGTHNWGTYLLGALGKGGRGLYMLDVTDHGSPKFKWYREKADAYLLSMDQDANHPTRTIGTSLNATDAKFMKIGFNSPRPVTGVASNMRNIIVLAGGSQSSKDLNNNGNEGAVLLVMDPYDGKVLKAFDGASFTGGIPRVGNASAGATPYMGMMIAEPTMYRSNISDLGRYLTGQLFAADNRGNMFRVSFENGTNASDVTPLDVSNWKIETVASLQTSVTGTSASFANPHGLVLDRVGSSIWVAGGTADLQLTRATEGDSGWLENNGGTGPQLIYAFKTDPDVSLPLLRTSSHKWVAVNKSDAGGAPSGSNGWYINLDTPQGKSREYMTTKPVIVNGVLFVSTFIEEQVETAADFAKCIPASIVTRGNSRLYALKLENGAAAGVWGSGQKYVTLENLKITGLTLTNIEKNNDRDKVALLISFDPNGPLPGFDAPGMFSARANGKIEMAGMWVSKPVGGKKDRFNPGETVISYWLESWGL